MTKKRMSLLCKKPHRARVTELQGQVSAMMSGIQLNTLVDFHVLTEEQLNGILSQINQA